MSIKWIPASAGMTIIFPHAVLFFSSKKIISAALFAAALACATDSGISAGPMQKPQAKIPGTFVSEGYGNPAATNPWAFNSTPNFFASSFDPFAGIAAVESTAISTLSDLTSLVSVSSYQRIGF